MSWLVKYLGLPDAEVLMAYHSVHREHGETDVLLFVRHEKHRVAVMIEDKIGAPMQPDQCERYHLRGAALCTKGQADRYLTVLCAPSGYLAGVPQGQRWDQLLPLEALVQQMADAAHPGWEWRQAILIAQRRAFGEFRTPD